MPARGIRGRAEQGGSIRGSLPARRGERGSRVPPRQASSRQGAGARVRAARRLLGASGAEQSKARASGAACTRRRGERGSRVPPRQAGQLAGCRRPREGSTVPAQGIRGRAEQGEREHQGAACPHRVGERGRRGSPRQAGQLTGCRRPREGSTAPARGIRGRAEQGEARASGAACTRRRGERGRRGTPRHASSSQGAGACVEGSTAPAQGDRGGRARREHQGAACPRREGASWGYKAL